MLNVMSVMPTVVGQLFSDVDGFLTSPDFLAPLANLITSFLTVLITGFLQALLGVGGMM